MFDFDEVLGSDSGEDPIDEEPAPDLWGQVREKLLAGCPEETAHALDEDAFGSTADDLVSIPLVQVSTCIRGHALALCVHASTSWPGLCRGCGTDFQRVKTARFSCAECEYDMCGECMCVPEVAPPPIAPAPEEKPRAALDDLAGQDAMTMTWAERGDCEDAASESAREAWQRRARRSLRDLGAKDAVPETSRLPRAALEWEPIAAALFVLTGGHFDPRSDGHLAGAQLQQRPDLVSVVCSTSDGRRGFHKLLYENFDQQRYEPKELVIVHTGVLPSLFLEEKADEDPRVIYRFFQVKSETRCKMGHPLERFLSKNTSYTCDSCCRARLPRGTPMWGCRVCNYDRCEACFQSAQAPGSPRMSSGSTASPLRAMVDDDNPLEILQWGQGDPGAQEIQQREEWTKGVKWNVACCLARGSVIAHFEDGCLYSPYYLGFMRSQVLNRPGVAAEEAADEPAPAAATLSKWYTVGLAELRFRCVDLLEAAECQPTCGSKAAEEAAPDLYAHNFTYVYTRSAWEVQPFPDKEFVGHEDYGFMKRLRKRGVPIKLVAENELVACGWHRLATCGSADASANINYSQVLNAFALRGEPVATPQAFKEILPSVTDIAYELLLQRELHVKNMIDERGPFFVCSTCNFGVALKSSLKDSKKRMKRKWPVWYGASGVSYMDMVFDVAEFSGAGGVVAEGKAVNWVDDNRWLRGWISRQAICRNCGVNLGWRHEKVSEYMEMCKSPGCSHRVFGPLPVKDVVLREPGKFATFSKKEYPAHCCVNCAENGGRTHDKKCAKKLAPEPTGPIFWTLICRQLRERHGPGERPPREKALGLQWQGESAESYNQETQCPRGHRLWCYGVQQPFYSCDVCGELLNSGQQMWGCSACEYDVCGRCRAT